MEGLEFDVPHLRLLPVHGSDHQLGRAVYLQSKDATKMEVSEGTWRAGKNSSNRVGSVVGMLKRYREAARKELPERDVVGISCAAKPAKYSNPILITTS
jgi:hypothetical protein